MSPVSGDPVLTSWRWGRTERPSRTHPSKVTVVASCHTVQSVLQSRSSCPIFSLTQNPPWRRAPSATSPRVVNYTRCLSRSPATRKPTIRRERTPPLGFHSCPSSVIEIDFQRRPLCKAERQENVSRFYRESLFLFAAVFAEKPSTCSLSLCGPE